ncbi:Vesicle-associated membrane protein 2 [Trichoplax sp. H2]|nr:Vesicle-associated membrane protein 2 [Trichoplax sp. H2]|eukprot:RDD44084.1 Vesicle-associated membrane protein 2 [Trichoplax sp. H2]
MADKDIKQSKRLQQTQAQVDEVVDIMRVNVDKVLERDQKLSELDNRADDDFACSSHPYNPHCDCHLGSYKEIAKQQ